MKNQTQELLSVTPPSIPTFIGPLVAAYHPTVNPSTQLDLTLYPEPYYGDFNNCSAVLLTHNPGSSTANWKGVGSVFETQLQASSDYAGNYHAMATEPSFPNTATNRFAVNISNQLHSQFEGIQVFENKLAFIRDLVPYHSKDFGGTMCMHECIPYLYNYFFNQVIEASLNSELYTRMNSMDSKPASVIFSRGKAWTDPNNGLASVGWKLIGRLFSYAKVFKLDFDKVLSFEGIENKEYYNSIRNHDIYIVAVTQTMPGAKYGIYSSNPDFPKKRTLINILDVVHQYEKGAAGIDHNEEMDIFISRIR